MTTNTVIECFEHPGMPAHSTSNCYERPPTSHGASLRVLPPLLSDPPPPPLFLRSASPRVTPFTWAHQQMCIDAQLQTEIKIHRTLQHPRVVRFEMFFEDRENVYILLELCTNHVRSDDTDGRGPTTRCVYPFP